MIIEKIGNVFNNDGNDRHSINIVKAHQLKNIYTQTKDLDFVARTKLLTEDEKISNRNIKLLYRYMKFICERNEYAKEYDMIDLEYNSMLEKLQNHSAMSGVATDLCELLFDLRVLGVVFSKIPSDIYDENNDSKHIISTWINFLYEYLIYMSKVYFESELGSFLDWDENSCQFTFLKFEDEATNNLAHFYINDLKEFILFMYEMFKNIEQNDDLAIRDMCLNFDLDKMLSKGVFAEYD